MFHRCATCEEVRIRKDQERSGKVRKDCIGDEGAESEGEALTCGHVLWVKERMRP